MPFIPQEARLGATLDPQTVGELCYAITRLCNIYMRREKESFSRYGEVRHALASAWDEYFFHKLHSYEIVKRKENGDVE